MPLQRLFMAPIDAELSAQRPLRIWKYVQISYRRNELHALSALLETNQEKEDDS